MVIRLRPYTIMSNPSPPPPFSYFVCFRPWLLTVEIVAHVPTDIPTEKKTGSGPDTVVVEAYNRDGLRDEVFTREGYKGALLYGGDSRGRYDENGVGGQCKTIYRHRSKALRKRDYFGGGYREQREGEWEGEGRRSRACVQPTRWKIFK